MTARMNSRTRGGPGAESATGRERTEQHTGFTLAADRSYAARLNRSEENGRHAERWTLDGPEPYAVSLPGPQPEPAGSQVLPLADGRVLIARPDREQCTFALLYPTGPETGELPLGGVPSPRATLLPPAPCGEQAYALVHGPRSTGLWRVAGGARRTPEQIAEIPGCATGGTWLDSGGFLLALDHCERGPGDIGTEKEEREPGKEAARGKVPAEAGTVAGSTAAAVIRAVRSVRTVRSGTTAGRDPDTVKTVVVDLGHGCSVTPLLEITEDSNDRLLAADPDSGLLLVRSDAPGDDRLGWGVLGSPRPLRFPEALHHEGLHLTPLAVQPGQVLLPESCAVALRVDGPEGAWAAVWSPAGGELQHLGAPEGWTGDAALWTREGELRLPVSTPAHPCGLARLRSSGPPPEAAASRIPRPAPPDRTPRPAAGPHTADPGRAARRTAEGDNEGSSGPGRPDNDPDGPGDGLPRTTPPPEPAVPDTADEPEYLDTLEPPAPLGPSDPRLSGGPAEMAGSLTDTGSFAPVPVPLQQAPLATRTA